MDIKDIKPQYGNRLGQVISEISVSHCERGPKKCKECKSNGMKYCLLALYDKSILSVAREKRTIEVNGRTYASIIEKVFKNKKEADDYAEKHVIQPVHP